ncbi:MAG: hypothetical protein ACJ0BG_05700 [Dehalococcoidia bacterium]|jgi:hypothetical protein|tara:strand:- start:63 stop:485 length:423 start_codon:yes stop_codon:yes gene_type:complete
MTKELKEAKESYKRWLQGFNSRDRDAMVAELHFPHLRLSGSNQIQVWDTAANINANFDEQTQKLKEEGWVRTDSNFIEAIQKGPDKVHLTMIQSRVHSDGSEYNRFETLWIFIRVNDRWGVKFRSSFLVNATENTNFDTL